MPYKRGRYSGGYSRRYYKSSSYRRKHGSFFKRVMGVVHYGQEKKIFREVTHAQEMINSATMSNSRTSIWNMILVDTNPFSTSGDTNFILSAPSHGEGPGDRIGDSISIHKISTTIGLTVNSTIIAENDFNDLINVPDQYRLIFYTVRDPLAFPAWGQIATGADGAMPVDFPIDMVEGFGARAFQQYRIISDRRYSCPHGAFNEHPFPDGETYGLATALASSNKPMTRYFH